MGGLQAVTGNGTLIRYNPDGSGVAGQAGGRPADSALVPFGDMNDDRRDDVLARDGKGALDRYHGDCTGAVSPTGPRTRVGTGDRQQFGTRTPPGDLTGDGRPDLVVRDKSTKDVLLYVTKPDGTPTAGVKIRSKRQRGHRVARHGRRQGDLRRPPGRGAGRGGLPVGVLSRALSRARIRAGFQARIPVRFRAWFRLGSRPGAGPGNNAVGAAGSCGYAGARGPLAQLVRAADF